MLEQPAPAWFNAPVQLLLRDSKPRSPLATLVAVLSAAHAAVAVLAGCWLLAQSFSAAGIALANVHIRDPFILPAQQAGSHYLVASSGRSVTLRQSRDLKTSGVNALL